MNWLFLRHPITIFIALIMLTLLAWSPFTKGTMLLTDDGNLHLYRTIVLNHSLEYDGRVYPRYTSGLAYGYGAPLFNYFSPVSYYLPVGLHRLGLSFTHAWLMSLCLYLFVGACGAYRLGRLWAGEKGGFLASVGYLYAPYLLFDAVTRGTITEVAGLALLPHVLASLTMLARGVGLRSWALATLTFALFVPLHNIVTLHGSLLIGAYSLFLVAQSEARLRLLIALASVGAIGLAMSAFFWLPSLAEAQFVKIEAISEALPFLDVTRYLRPLGESLVLLHTADNSRLQLPVPITFSVSQVVIALLGGVVALIVGRGRRLPTLFWGVAVGVVAFMTLRVSKPVWEIVPLLDYTQYAWRILGVGSLALAVATALGGVALIHRLASKTRQNALYALFLFVIGLSSMAWLFRPSVMLVADGITDAQDYERSTGEVALSSFSEYLPIWNESPEALLPDGLQEAWTASPIVARLKPQDGVTVQAESWGGLWGDVLVQTDNPVRLEFQWLYTPNWQATLDGQALDISPTSPEGFIGVDVPAGTHDLRVFWTETPLENTANLVSMVALLMVLAVWVYAALKPITPLVSSLPESPDVGARLGAISVGLALVLLKVLVLDNTDTPFHTQRFQDGVLLGESRPINADFGREIILLASGLPESVKSGVWMPFSAFYSLSSGRLSRDYAASYSLKDSDGNLVVNTGRFLIGDLPTTEWREGFYLQDNTGLELPHFLPPDEYSLSVNIFDPQTQEQLSVINAVGNPEGVTASLGVIRVERPEASTPYEGNGNPIFADLPLVLGDTIGLPASATTGDELNFSWVWHTTEALQESYLARLVWGDGTTVMAQTPFVPLARYGTENWQMGDTWRGYHRLYVPAELEAGRYQIGVQVADARQNYPPVWIHFMTIEAPSRTFEAPSPQYPLQNAVWENGVRLLGYDVIPEGLMLYWTTDAPVTTSLRRFVHRVQDGQILAQTDGIPKDWTRPTTGWQVGEVLEDVTIILLPEGANGAWSVGLYDPITGQRIPVGDGDTLTLPDN